MKQTSYPEGQNSLDKAWALRDSDSSRALMLIGSADLPLEEPETWARVAVLRAFLLYRRGELQEALPLILKATDQLTTDPLSAWNGRASNTAALIYSSLGLSELATEFLLAGQQQSLSIGDRETAFSCFHNMGVELGQLGDFEGALENYRKAETFAEAGFEGHAFLALNRCDLYLDRGDVARALTTVEAGKRHWTGSNSQAEVFGLLVEARVALANKDPDTASIALKKIPANFGRDRAGYELPLLEARLLLAQGDYAGAEALLLAHDLGEESSAIEDVYLAARLVELHAELAETQGDYRRALSIVRAARHNEKRERRQAMSRVTTLIMKENTRLLEVQNQQLAEAVEELRLLHAEVNELALRDHLTGLHNRRYLAEHVDDLVNQHHRYGRDLSLLVFDIDNFKSINDTYLHSTGDSVLQQIAALLKSQARAADVLCRVGGDEFVALLPETDVKSAQLMAQRIHAAVQTYHWSSVADGLEVGVSIGATTANSGASLQELLLAADRAMYRAKSAGKNQIEIGSVTTA